MKFERAIKPFVVPVPCPFCTEPLTISRYLHEVKKGLKTGTCFCRNEQCTEYRVYYAMELTEMPTLGNQRTSSPNINMRITEQLPANWRKKLGGKTPTPLMERIKARTGPRDPETGCIPYVPTKPISSKRAIYIQDEDGRVLSILRVIWEDAYPDRPLSSVQQIRRKCGNHLCINYEHFFVIG